MPDYRPAFTGPVILEAGVWAAPPLPDRNVRITLDPRIYRWLVNQAAKRTSLTYVIKQGTPPIECRLT
ncbi:MAG TPA: hypothetical protein VMQ76_05350 [Terracidiphilus sp.]|jgi:hypothetical protein|nr:hypothetical protein [Terracidiphilus sp.]